MDGQRKVSRNEGNGTAEHGRWNRDERDKGRKGVGSLPLLVNPVPIASLCLTIFM